MSIKRLMMFCCLAYCTMAQAGGSGSGQIVSFTPVVLNGVEFVVFTVQTLNNDKPACNTDGRFVLTSTDAKYKTVFAALMGAYFSQSAVFVRGQGTCNTYGGSEDLWYMCFNGGVTC